MGNSLNDELRDFLNEINKEEKRTLTNDDSENQGKKDDSSGQYKTENDSSGEYISPPGGDKRRRSRDLRFSFVRDANSVVSIILIVFTVLGIILSIYYFKKISLLIATVFIWIITRIVIIAIVLCVVFIILRLFLRDRRRRYY